MGDLQFFQQRDQFLLTAGVVQFLAQLQHQADVVGHGELAEDRRLLRQIADAQLGACVHRFGSEVAAIQFDTAGIGFDQTHDHVEAGGLAGAIGAEQTDHFAGLEREAELLDHFALLVLLAQTGGDQHYFFPCGLAAGLAAGVAAGVAAAGAAFFGWMMVRTRLPSPPLCMLPVLVL